MSSEGLDYVDHQERNIIGFVVIYDEGEENKPEDSVDHELDAQEVLEHPVENSPEGQFEIVAEDSDSHALDNTNKEVKEDACEAPVR